MCPGVRVWCVILPLLLSGCRDAPDLRDQRLADFARQAMTEQHAQNDRIADLLSAQQQLNSQLDLQRAEIHAGRDQLEVDRRELAVQRQREPVIAAAVEATGLLLAAILPLLVCICVIRQMSHAEPDHAAVAELLVTELTSLEPRLLSGPAMGPVSRGFREHLEFRQGDSSDDSEPPF